MALLSRIFSAFCDDKDKRAKAIVIGTSIEAGGIGLFTAQVPGVLVGHDGIKSKYIKPLMFKGCKAKNNQE